MTSRLRTPFRQDTPFYPPVPEVRASGWLEVGDGHEIYWEETGNSDGVPVLVIHGGPGGSIRPYYRRLIDPEHCRGIFFDQRGCGKSRATDPLAKNTTDSLVEDIEALRRKKGIDRWIVLGGSWGSTLALRYSQCHPERVAGLCVSGVFLARQCDIDWWWEGPRSILPDVFEVRDAILDETERTDPRSAFHKRIFSADHATALEAANVLLEAESQTLNLIDPLPAELPSLEREETLAAMKIFMHFDAANFFLEEGQLLADAHRLNGIPGAILAGRTDLCTPPDGAWQLDKLWETGDLKIVANAGHRWSDQILGLALVPALNELVRQTA